MKDLFEMYSQIREEQGLAYIKPEVEEEINDLDDNTSFPNNETEINTDELLEKIKNLEEKISALTEGGENNNLEQEGEK